MPKCTKLRPNSTKGHGRTEPWARILRSTGPPATGNEQSSLHVGPLGLPNIFPSPPRPCRSKPSPTVSLVPLPPYASGKPIRVFTLPRFGCSPSSDLGVHLGARSATTPVLQSQWGPLCHEVWRQWRSCADPARLGVVRHGRELQLYGRGLHLRPHLGARLLDLAPGGSHRPTPAVISSVSAIHAALG